MNLIMYNTAIGVAAGLALLLVPRAWAQLTKTAMPLQGTGSQPVQPAGWAAAFGVLGAVLTALGFMMTVTHPLAAAAPHVDTLFGEPSLLLGVLLLAAAWLLARADRHGIDAHQMQAALVPAGWIVAALGVVLLACTAAILRFTAVGAAPTAEPVTGLLNAYPQVENSFFAALYALAGVGCLLFPAAIRGGRLAWPVLYWSWTVAGLSFLLFSALNYYTHTGMIINVDDPGPDLRW